jgi:hypothetical protein
MPRTATSKLSPFMTAKETTPKSKSDTAKGTTWSIGGPDIAVLDLTYDAVADAVAELNMLASEQKAAEAKLNACKATIKIFADNELFAYWAKYEQKPEAPLRLVNAYNGAACTYIVQDRTGSSPATDAAIEAIRGIFAVGDDDPCKDMTYTTESYAFNPEVISIRVRDPKTGRKITLQEMIGRSVTPLLDSLVENGSLTKEEAASLLILNRFTGWTDGILDKITALADGDADVLSRAVNATGAVVRYAKSS